MKYSELEHYLSSPRLSRYYEATGSKSKAIKLYKANLRLSQAFHPLIGVTEVALRNCLDTVLSKYFEDQDWIVNQKKGFMVDKSLTHKDKMTGEIRKERYLLNQVKKAEKGIQKTGGTITAGKVIAEQTFGFWTTLFEVHYYKLLKGTPISIFNSLPSGYGRKEVLADLNRVRRFRNRINHNEPICFIHGKADFSRAESVHTSILEILTWLNRNFKNWIKDMIMLRPN